MNKLETAKQAAREAAFNNTQLKFHATYRETTSEDYKYFFDAGIAFAESQNDFHTQLAYESGYKAAESQGGWVTPEAQAFTVDDIKTLGFPNNIGTCPLCSNTVSVMLQEGDQIAECNDCSFSVDLRDYYGLHF